MAATVKAASESWEKASDSRKRFKILLWGPPGCFKTRTMLRLGHRDGEPALAVVDPEYGTDHYADEFNFRRKQILDPDEIYTEVDKLVRNPGGIISLGLDSFSIYYESLVSKFADYFLKRETGGKGHKVEYYTLQPRDYQPINREAYKLVRLLLKCDLHIIATCQTKDKWEDMRVVGTTYDGPKKMAYYFDTIIEISEKTDATGRPTGYVGIVKKDRSRKIKIGAEIPWNDDKEIYDALVAAFGQDLSKGAKAKSFGDHVKETVEAAQEEKQEESPFKEPETVQEENAEEPKDENRGEPSEGPNRAQLLDKVIELKKDLRIVDRKVWDDLLKPFKVKTAKDLTVRDLGKFIEVLEAMRPS